MRKDGLQAWHGSGRRFNRFDTRFIGTGEGGALGWGFYFLDNRTGAQRYQDFLSPRDGSGGYMYRVWLNVYPGEMPKLHRPIDEQCQIAQQRLVRALGAKAAEANGRFALEHIYDDLRQKEGNQSASMRLLNAGIVGFETDEEEPRHQSNTYFMIDTSRIEILSCMKWAENTNKSPSEWEYELA